MPHNAIAFEVKEVSHPAPPGAYKFVRYNRGTDIQPDDRPDGMIHGCPCGCGIWSGVWFKGRGGGKPEWDVTGEWPKVTLSPSIGIRGPNGERFHWHGFLRNGVFEEC